MNSTRKCHFLKSAIPIILRRHSQRRLCAYLPHTEIPENVYKATKLICDFTKEGNLKEASYVFDKIANANEVSWTAMVTGYIRHGFCKEGLALFCRMHRSGLCVDTFVFPSVIKACASVQHMRFGEQIHCFIMKRGFESHVPTATAFVDMYAKFARLDSAWDVFVEIKHRSFVSWNAMIGGCAHGGQYEEALQLFVEMQEEGIKPTYVTLILLLSACTGSAIPQLGKEIHGYALRNGLERDIYVETALVDLYVKNSDLESAWSIFSSMPIRSLVSWNSMIVGYAYMGLLPETLVLFSQILVRGFKPDLVTWTALISCYARTGDTHQTFKLLHLMQRSGIKLNVVSWTALITGFGNGGHCEEALCSFREMQMQGLNPDTVSWNALIGAFVQNKLWCKALTLFQQMVKESMEPNSITLVTVLIACSNLAALHCGKEIHNYILKTGMQRHSFIGNSMLDTYSKCGDIESARKIFDTVPCKTIVLWNAMIAAYAMHGRGELSLDLFEELQRQGIKPDHITFTGVLTACSHKGLVMEGKNFYQMMISKYKITPTMEHYTCMVDLLGRNGLLEEAWELVIGMQSESDFSILSSLLGVCKIHGSVELAEVVAQHLTRLHHEIRHERLL